MRKVRTAGIGMAATAAVAGIGLAAGLPATIASAGQKDRATERAISERSVSKQQAGRIADRAIERRTGKSARVTGIGREDDYGAQWEVEVTLQNGREFDVYVNRSGRVVKVISKGRDWRSGPAKANQDSVGSAATSSAATATALAHIEQLTGQSARVTGVEREDDYGARWEVEVTLANGFEYDVYIGAGGEVIRTKANGFDD